MNTNHRKNYLITLVSFLVILIISCIGPLMMPKSISKYKTTWSQPLGASLNVVLDKREYNSKTNTLKISYSLTGADKTVDSNVSTLSASPDATSLESLSNTTFQAAVFGFKGSKRYSNLKVYRVRDNYLEIIVHDVPSDFRLAKVQIAPKTINKTMQSTDVEDDTISSFYILEKDFKSVNTIHADKKNRQNDYLSYQISSIQEIIGTLNKKNSGYKLDNQQKRKLIKKFVSMQKYDTDEDRKSHGAQIETYKSTIKENNLEIDKNKEQISELKSQIEQLKKAM